MQRTTRTGEAPACTRSARLAGHANDCPFRTGSRPKSPDTHPSPATSIAMQNRPSLPMS